jgi:hypothetical protein
MFCTVRVYGAARFEAATARVLLEGVGERNVQGTVETAKSVNPRLMET